MMSTKVEGIWAVHNNIQELIKFSDVKAGAILAFYSILGSIAVPYLIKCKQVLSEDLIMALIATLIVVFSIFSILFAVASVWPRYRSSQGSSLLFYRLIVEKFPSDVPYAFNFTRTFDDDDRAVKEISKQVLALSRIAKAKYQCVSCSIIGLIISVLLLVILTTVILFSNEYTRIVDLI